MPSLVTGAMPHIGPGVVVLLEGGGLCGTKLRTTWYIFYEALNNFTYVVLANFGENAQRIVGRKGLNDFVESSYRASFCSSNASSRPATYFCVLSLKITKEHNKQLQ